MNVNCPTCQTAVPWNSNNAYRPFCCERCKIIDLGDWASEKMSIPADPEHDDATASDFDRD